MPAMDAIEKLVGLQAQQPIDPYFGLWTRLDGFQTDELASLIAERRAVRVALMRSTIHLASARDALTIWPIVRPVLQRTLFSSSPFAKNIAGVDFDALLARGQKLLVEQPRTISELGKLLQEEWPGRDPTSLARVVHYLTPLVQVPPRGIWGAGGRPAVTTATSWLDQPLASDTAADDLVLRYLASFGPATPADVQTWSGLTGARAILERLRPRLRTFRDERGRELFDVPDAPLPDPGVPAPPRFLPQYDNVFLSHAERGRIMPDTHRRRVLGGNLGVRTLLIDGFIAGTWRIRRERSGAILRVEPFELLAARDREELVPEAERLLAFVAPDAPNRDVQIATPD